MACAPIKVVSGVEKNIAELKLHRAICRGVIFKVTVDIFGDYTQVGPNVSVISANHDVGDTRATHYNPVRIGKYCLEVAL